MNADFSDNGSVEFLYEGSIFLVRGAGSQGEDHFSCDHGFAPVRCHSLSRQRLPHSLVRGRRRPGQASTNDSKQGTPTQPSECPAHTDSLGVRYLKAGRTNGPEAPAHARLWTARQIAGENVLAGCHLRQGPAKSPADTRARPSLRFGRCAPTSSVIAITWSETFVRPASVGQQSSNQKAFQRGLLGGSAQRVGRKRTERPREQAKEHLLDAKEPSIHTGVTS